jgi:hypothetical protein
MIKNPSIANLKTTMAFTTTTTTTIEEEAHNASAAEPIISSEGTNGRKIIHHVMILEHGICGNASELGYVSEACLREYNSESESKTRNKESASSLLVHSAVCNEGRLSLDGIENGGLRLANEINNVIRGVAIDKHKHNNDERVTTIALSIVGNSMGGLYGRYALKYIKFFFTLQAEVVGSTNTTVAVDVLVVPNVFVTTATPHLGIKNMTYWKVPEFLEPVGAWMFGKSSNDLFRRNNKINNANSNANNTNANTNTHNYNDIIEQLAFDPEFISPLSKFKRRIAYANAFSTDIAVTTATAAFLVEENNNDDNNDDNDDIYKDPCYSSILESSINDIDIDNDNTPQDFEDESRSSLIIEEGKKSELLTTESSHIFVSKQYSSICFDTANTAQYNRSTSSLRKSGSSPLSVSDMARNLDSLGWSKVFVDNRPHIPALWKRKRKSFDLFESSTPTTTTTTKSGDGGTSTRINSSANNTDCYYSSCELKRRFSTNGWDGNTLPFGHSFLVASSRDPVHRFLYKSARPFVDQVIAKKVMNEMLQF